MMFTSWLQVVICGWNGIKIDHAMGLLGHSDADVPIHAICDALLGAPICVI